jgi:hypothetical protein
MEDVALQRFFDALSPEERAEIERNARVLQEAIKQARPSHHPFSIAMATETVTKTYYTTMSVVVNKKAKAAK